MAQKINLAVLNKKKEEIDQKEMHEIRGKAGCSYCGVDLELNSSSNKAIELIECGCGNVWVVFGLSW